MKNDQGLRSIAAMSLLSAGIGLPSSLPGFPEHGPPLRIKSMPPPIPLTKRQRRRLRGKGQP